MNTNEEFSHAVRCSATLSAIAYTSPERTIGELLSKPGLPMGPQTKLVWGPEKRLSNLVFVAGGLQTEDGRPRYIVSIRGTVKRIESIFEDIDLKLEPLPWKNTRFADARISQGIEIGIRHIQAMKSGRPGHHHHLLEFLSSTPDDAEIIVTGHSQGGCLASVVALWLSEELAGSSRSVVPYTFAGETAGESHFAEAFRERFSTGCRYYNRIDVVPKSWNVEDLGTVVELFPGDGPKANGFLRTAVRAVQATAKSKGFVQPEPSYALPGEVYDVRGIGKFVKEIGHQHDHFYYMWLTGVPLAAIHVLQPTWAPPPSE